MARRRPHRSLGGGQVGPGTVVALSLEVYDADGELAAASDPLEPLTFIFGYGQMSPGLEAGLAGATSGQARRVRLRPDEAFGRRDPAGIIEVAREELPADLGVGDELEAEQDAGGGALTLKVLEITESVVVLDTNHPLADQDVDLDVVVEDVRPATAAELAAAESALRSVRAPTLGTLIPAERLLKRSVR